MLPPHIARVDYGAGCAQDIAKAYDSYLAVSMDVPWAITRDVLGKPPRQLHLVQSVNFGEVDRLAETAPAVEAVIGIGGGQAVDVAKYVAWKRGLKLVLIPTIVSTDAFATPAAGLRKGSKVEYLGEARIDRLIVDYDLIKTAPAELNISGAGDILSCHTACWDWKLACERGREPLGYQPETARSSLALVEKLDAAAEEIRRVTNAGIRTLVECEIEIVDICIGPGGPGHFRSEEGSEHFFFYNVERLTRRGFVHGWIVGLGIFLMSRLQENRAAWIAGLMDRLGLPYQPREMCLTREDVSAALLSLRRQTREDGRWWSVIDEREITTPFVAAALEDLRTA